jgi:hypothetical protein
VKARDSLPLKCKLHNKVVLIDWLKGLAKCNLAVTITFGSGRGGFLTSPGRCTVEEILRKGIKRLNSLCYRNLVKRKGYSIGAVAVIEGNTPLQRIHAHIGFELPPDMSLIWFRSQVIKVFKTSKWIEQRPHMKKCWDQYWISYMLKLGQEALVPSCCFAAKHPNANPLQTLCRRDAAESMSMTLIRLPMTKLDPNFEVKNGK